MYAHSQRLSEVKKCQTGVSRGGFVWLDVCICQMSDVIFPPTLWKMRESGQRACKVKGCQADVSSHLPSLFLHLLLSSISVSILPLFIISPKFSLSSFFLSHREASQTAPSWNRVWKYSGTYQLLLNLLSDCQIPHHSCMRTYTYAHIHTPPGKVKQPLFSQKIDIKKEEPKNTLLIRSWGDCHKSFPLWWQNGKHMSKSCLLGKQSLQKAFSNDPTTPSNPYP